MGPLAPVIHSLLQDLSRGVSRKRSDLASEWPSIVGKPLSAHTKPSLLSRGTVCIWADDSTLAFELSQKYQGTILRRLEALLGEGAVKRLIFRVGQIRSR